MKTRLPTLAASLTVAFAALAACGEDKVTDVQTVLLPFSTAMTQEVTTEPVWNGDTDGTGSALITIHAVTGELCWNMSVSRIQLPATASHIHKAAPGVRGGIVVGLSAPDANGVASGCNASLDRALLMDIIENPESYYVNVHTTDFAPGAIRGQLPH